MNRNADALKKKARKMQVSQRRGEHGAIQVFDVKSTSGKNYIVWEKRDQNLSCNCPWGVCHYGGNEVCSHILAAKMHKEDMVHARRVSFWATDEDATRQHRPTERFQDVRMTVRAAA